MFEVPAAKSLDSFILKLNSPDITRPSQIFDYLRFTIIGKNPEVCKRIQDSLERIIDMYDWFAPLSKNERTIGGKEKQQTSNFVNENSAKELITLVDNGEAYATTTHFQVGPKAIDSRYTPYEDQGLIENPIPGMRVEVSVITPKVWCALNDPCSSANHENYALRKDVSRFGTYDRRKENGIVSKWDMFPGYRLLAKCILELNINAARTLLHDILYPYIIP